MVLIPVTPLQLHVGPGAGSSNSINQFEKAFLADMCAKAFSPPPPFNRPYLAFKFQRMESKAMYDLFLLFFNL